MLASGPGKVSDRLLDWYDANARSLPWRSAPGQDRADPYRIWLSEIMLQQTTVAAVTPYFERFISRWPTIEALAAADDADVMAAWAGLGYYARARNLLSCARAVAHNHGGRFPADEAGLRSLLGIGAYTAAAIAAIAFGKRAVVIDGNVERVVARLFALAQPLPLAKRRIAEHADRLTPNHRPGDFAQAMMDLGATVCRPRAPACPLCPLQSCCEARALGQPEAFPVRPARPDRPSRTGLAYVLEHRGQVLLERRPPRGLLGGMNGFPAEPPAAADWRSAGQVRHVFTHFGLTLHVMHATSEGRPGGLWWPVADLHRAGLPTLFRKAASQVWQ